jgi:Protein of unknown function (DUF3225)
LTYYIAYLQFRLMGSFLLAGVIPPSCSMNKFGHGFISFIVSTMLTIAAFPAIGQQSEATIQAEKAQVCSEVRALVQRALGSLKINDSDSYLSCFWKSPDFLYIDARETTRGWPEAREKILRAAVTPERRGKSNADQVQINYAGTDLGMALISWTADSPSPFNRGVTMLACSRFPDGWRIIFENTEIY